MTRATSAAHARLVEACGQPGCPVCRCVAGASTRYLEALVHEHVTDVETRRRLRRAGGLCARHAAMLEALPGAAFGAAILYEDLLRLAVERFDRRASGPAGPSSGARRWLARVARRGPSAGAGDARIACPACVDAAGAETRVIDALLGVGADAALRSAYESSDGMCVPHLTLALERGGRRADTVALRQTTVAKWKALRETLERFIARHDHRSRARVAESEARALARALATVQGPLPPGVR